MQTHNPKHLYRLLLSISALLALSACSFNFGGGQATMHTSHNNISPTPQGVGILLGEQPCPGAIKDIAHWNQIIHPGSGQTIEQVLCGNLVGAPSLQATVQVRHTGDAHLLDVSV